MKKLLALLLGLSMNCTAFSSHVLNPDSLDFRQVELEAGSPVILELQERLMPEFIQLGAIVELRTVLPVMSRGEKLILENAPAFAVVTKARKPGIFGKAGMIEITPKQVQARDGSMIKLNGQPIQFTGESRSVLAVGLSAGIPAAGLAGKQPYFLAFGLTGLLIKGEQPKELPPLTRFEAITAAPAIIASPR